MKHFLSSRALCFVGPLSCLGGLFLLAACIEEQPGSDAVNAASTSVSSSSSARPVHWTYEGKEGPENWGKLSPVYAACGNGQAQSPINLIATQESNAIPLIFDYKRSGLKIAHHENVMDIIDNGHTIQVTVDVGSTLTTRRDIYDLAQFHFHTPSEHTVGGKSFPMEAHFVHQSDKKNFAVISVLFEEGASNANLDRLITHFPAAKGDTLHEPEVKLDLGSHLPRSPLVYSYMGSFTTPPCTENVEWFVMQTPLTASRAQLDAFAARLGHNNRPIQPLRGRVSEVNQVTKGLKR